LLNVKPGSSSSPCSSNSSSFAPAKREAQGTPIPSAAAVLFGIGAFGNQACAADCKNLVDGHCESDPALRKQIAVKEASRMLAMRKASFPTLAAWGLGVLSAQACNVSAVQRAYRMLMKKLHPDRVGHSKDLAQAIEMAREARDCCERAFLQQDLPGSPAHLSSSILSAVPGRWQIRLEWGAPELTEPAPVHKYIVAAFDPAYGRAITVAILEPDYDEELRRFVPIEELRSYVLAEQNLSKIPGLFLTPSITLQVAAANGAGQSSWSTLHVPLKNGTKRKVPGGAK